MLSFKRTYTLQFDNKIPNYINIYLNEVAFLKRLAKFYKRYLFILFKGQKKLEVFKILPNHKNILWINVSAPSLGDSLMDLSSRSMLINKNIDLFTDIKNAHIFQSDEIFRNTYVDVERVRKNKYDLIILDSYSTRSIRIKSKVAPNTFYVGMFGYFNGPEVNRILFSFNQMNNLLGNHKSKEEINRIAKILITISKKDKEIIRDKLPQKIYIAIAVGGEWKYKTYDYWSNLIEKIIQENEMINLVLIGSKNGLNESEKILKKFKKHNIFNLVSKLTFNQTAEVIRRSSLLICCDGGLMHAGNAVGTKMIALLARLSPEMLLTNPETITLTDDVDVNNINYDDIFLKLIE